MHSIDFRHCDKLAIHPAGPAGLDFIHSDSGQAGGEVTVASPSIAQGLSGFPAALNGRIEELLPHLWQKPAA